MKIVFLTRRFYPDIGGVEKHVLKLSQELLKQGFQIEIVTESPSTTETTFNSSQETEKTSLNSNKQSRYKSDKKTDKQFIYDKSIKTTYLNIMDENRGHYQESINPPASMNGFIIVHRLRRVKNNRIKKFYIWKSLWRNREIFKNSDIIHCHDVFYWYLPFRFLYPYKKVFTTFHGYESYPIPLGNKIVRKLSEKLSYGNICIGDFVAKWYGTKPTYVSYGAVDILDNKHFKSTFKKDSALFIGRTDEQTGILEYVEAVEIIRKKYPNFEFVVIGDGKYRKDIKHKVVTKGFLEKPEQYLEQFHFAFVSRYLSILEAMYAKRLVFAIYDNPIKEDYLKMSPFSKYIVIVKNSDELAKKVTYYLEFPEEEKQLVNNAFLWVKNNSWQALAKLYIDLWNN